MCVIPRGSANTSYVSLPVGQFSPSAGGAGRASGRQTVARICGRCAAEFQALPNDVRRGRARFCSLKCSYRDHPLPVLAGSANPAWKGGISKNHVHYKNLFRARHPEKAAAHDAVHKALRRGDLVRPVACDACGSVGKPHAHHDDYTRPLSVRWLCRPCHREADRQRQLLGVAA